jgi:hypothetical protein
VSLQYYPHEDLELKPAARSEGMGSAAGDYVAIAIIDMILAMALVSFAVDGGVIGTLVVLGLIAGFNMLALGGRG